VKAQSIKRGDIWWVSLDPTQGSETKKTRPCIVLSQDTLNRLRRTVVVIPLSSAAQAHPPITIPVSCQGKNAVAIIDQIRAVGKHRLKSRIEGADPADLQAVGNGVAEILQLS